MSILKGCMFSYDVEIAESDFTQTFHWGKKKRSSCDFNGVCVAIEVITQRFPHWFMTCRRHRPQTPWFAQSSAAVGLANQG